MTALAFVAQALVNTGDILTFILHGSGSAATASDVVIPFATGVAAAVQKGYAWNDAPGGTE